MAIEQLTWNHLLSSSLWASVVEGEECRLDEFAMWNVPSDLVTRIIRGHRCQNKRELFHEWAAALQFPYYFGNNWSAFDDCVGDLKWMGDRVVIFVARADALLAQQEANLGMLIDILKKAVETPVTAWEEGLPTRVRFLHFVFHASSAQSIQARLAEHEQALAVRRL